MNTRAQIAVALAATTVPLLALASSHREAPGIAGMPKLDGTDLYLFRSYETGRAGYVTIIANYLPLQDPAGGPNFYRLDTAGAYDINIDNTGDATPAYTFRFRFIDAQKNLAVPAGNQQTPVPLINIGPVDQAGANLNVQESYTLQLILPNGEQLPVQNAATGATSFLKPADNIGEKSIPNYAGYASEFIYPITVPGCSSQGRVFVGQRKEGFVVNLGEIFDLVNTNPLGPRNGAPNTLSRKNITSLALELPISCLVHGDSVIGAWTTSSTLEANGSWKQVSRLGMPLVNEVVIGLPDKDRFNGSFPQYDAQFLKYVTNPSLPVLLNVLFGNAAVPPGTPRYDLVAAFLTGLKGLNQPLKIHPAEMLRLNTAIAPTPPAQQSDLGVLGGDTAGFPNGRRPYDDVVDITLRVAEGLLCSAATPCGAETSDPNHGAPYTDGARAAGPDASHITAGGAIDPADTYLDAFPYLNTPLPGSPNGPNGINP
jgi:hypothetical protein